MTKQSINNENRRDLTKSGCVWSSYALPDHGHSYSIVLRFILTCCTTGTNIIQITQGITYRNYAI